MFRYVAFVGGDSDSDLSRLADRLFAPTHGWHTVLSCGGLRVLCKDVRPGSSEVYRLDNDAGVILGKLFETAPLGEPHRHTPLKLDEIKSRAILRSAGRHLIEHHWGRYVAFLRDPSSSSISVIRDPSGALPCLRIRVRETYVYASSMEDASLLLGQPPTINWEYVAAWLSARVSCRETGLREVQQVLGGECETVLDGHATREIYWHPFSIAESRRIEAVPAAVDALRETVRACVHAWASCYDGILHALSGGLDSSIVAICLKSAPSRPRVTCFSRYSVGPASDEREYAQAVADRCGFPLLTLEDGASTDLRPMLGVRKAATLWNLAHHTQCSREEAELAVNHGASALFTGEGGDQAFYQVRAAFAAADCLRWRHWRHWFAVALDAARMDHQSLWRVLYEALRAQLPGGAWSPQREIGKFRALLTPEALATARRSSFVLHPWFSSQRSAPNGTRWHAAMMMLERPFYDPFLTEAHEPVAPLMAQPVVELCLRIPSWVHIYSGWDRCIARLAFADELPEAIIGRRAKGGFEQRSWRVLQHNASFVRKMLCDGLLVEHGVLDRRKVADLFSDAPSTVRSGSLELYDCLSVEAWLRSWVGNQTTGA